MSHPGGRGFEQGGRAPRGPRGGRGGRGGAVDENCETHNDNGGAYRLAGTRGPHSFTLTAIHSPHTTPS